MNPYLVLTDTPSRISRRFSQELLLHLEFPILFTEPRQLDPFRLRQDRFVTCILTPVLVHPHPQRFRPNLVLFSDSRHRPRRIDDRTNRFRLELITETLWCHLLRLSRRPRELYPMGHQSEINPPLHSRGQRNTNCEWSVSAGVA